MRSPSRSARTAIPRTQGVERPVGAGKSHRAVREAPSARRNGLKEEEREISTIFETKELIDLIEDAESDGVLEAAALEAKRSSWTSTRRTSRSCGASSRSVGSSSRPSTRARRRTMTTRGRRPTSQTPVRRLGSSPI
jgi:hypothetical protein